MYNIDPKVLKNIEVSEKITINDAVIRAIADAIAHPSWKMHASGLKDAFTEVSKYSNLRVLLAFTAVAEGCPYCVALKKEVFDTTAFGWWAWNNGMILANIDFDCFPGAPSCNPPPADVAAYNQYKGNGFPTVIIFNSKGTECGRYVGYNPGTGVTAYTTQLGVKANLHVSGGPCNRGW